MEQTPNLGLILTPKSQTKTVQEWRLEMSGDDASSNMMKIDAEIAKKQDLLSDAKEVSEAKSTDKMVIIRNGSVCLAPPNIPSNSGGTSQGSTSDSSYGLYKFDIDASGNLILYYNGDEEPDFHIDGNGDLIAGFANGNLLNVGHVVGKDGVDGVNGHDGVSVTHEWVGSTLKITSASGTTSADLKGEQGIDGADGYSPTIDVSREVDKTVLTITDVNGTKTADIPDGKDGAVSSVNGQTGAVELTAEDVGAATANDVNQLKSDLAGITVTNINGVTEKSGEYNLYALADEENTWEDFISQTSVCKILGQRAMFSSNTLTHELNANYNALKIPVEAGDVIRFKLMPYYFLSSNGTNFLFLHNSSTDTWTSKRIGWGDSAQSYDILNTDLAKNGFIIPDNTDYLIVNIYRHYYLSDGKIQYNETFAAEIVTKNMPASYTEYDNSTQAPNYVPLTGVKYYEVEADLRIPRYETALGDIKSDIAAKITALSTAAVGQTIRVKTVDENGKPTEWEATDAESGEIDISRDPDLVIEVAEAVAQFSISEINGVPINTTEMVVLWEHPSGDTYTPNYFRFNNAVTNATVTTAVLANLSFPSSICPTAVKAAAILSRVKKLNDSLYYYEFSGIQQNPGTVSSVYQPVYGGPYFNIFDGETSIKEFFVYQGSKIQPGCKVSIWVK